MVEFFKLRLRYGKFPGSVSISCDKKQILQGHSLNIKIYPLEVGNIQRAAAELNIISTRVDKSYIQQEWACYICFIIYLLTFF